MHDGGLALHLNGGRAQYDPPDGLRAHQPILLPLASLGKLVGAGLVRWAEKEDRGLTEGCRPYLRILYM